MEKLKWGDEDWELNKAIFSSQALKILPKGKFDILEVGCGTGKYILPLAKIGRKVTGIEIEKSRVAICKRKCKQYKIKANISQGDARKLPFKDHSFDLVFNHGVVEHFKETEKAIQESYRVLKEGGYLMISVPSRISSFILLKNLQIFLDKIFHTKLWTIGYEKSFTPWYFKNLLKRNKFKILKFELALPGPGKRFPLIGRIMRILDLPFYWFKLGGHFMFFLCRK